MKPAELPVRVTQYAAPAPHEGATRSAVGSVSGNEPVRGRLEPIDALRGAVIALMTLDHVRDFFDGFTPGSPEPLDLSATTPGLFLTRWVTHFCAPVFVFLAGTAAYLSQNKSQSSGATARLLVTRGLWLIFLELTVVRFGWLFDLNYNRSPLQVIWAIGCSMIVLGCLVRLKPAVVGTLGAVLIAGHNLLDGIHANQLGSWSWLWAILHESRLLALAPRVHIWVVYPVCRWFAEIKRRRRDGWLAYL
jgi:uncharacterized membrane protein